MDVWAIARILDIESIGAIGLLMHVCHLMCKSFSRYRSKNRISGLVTSYVHFEPEFF